MIEKKNNTKKNFNGLQAGILSAAAAAAVALLQLIHDEGWTERSLEGIQTEGGK